MRRYLGTTTFLASCASLALSLPAWGQTCSVPSVAKAAGYTTQTFGAPLVVGTTPDPSTSYPEVTGGANVVPYTFTGTSWTNIGETNSNGSVTLNGTGEAYGNGLATATATAAGQTLNGIAFGGGGYFQVTMSGNGPMSFWMNDAETMNGLSNGTVNGQSGSWMEADIAEFDSTGVYGFALHNWTSTANGGQGISTLNSGSPASPAGANYNQPNTYGMLWVPATATTQGSVKWYFNGQQVGNTITWNQYIPGQAAADNPYAVIDSLHMVPILGSGQGSNTTFSNLQVWQASNANDIGTQVAAASAAAPCGDGGSGASAPVVANATATPSVTSAVAASTSASTSALTGEQSAAAPTVESAMIKPGGGSITDDNGDTWTITADGRIEQNGQLIDGGGDTAALTVVNGTVWGQDNDDDPSRTNAGGWFTLNGNGWEPSTTSPTASPTTTPAATTPSTTSALSGTTSPTAATISDYVGACTAGVPNSPAADGGFGTVNGQFYDPSGQPWVAHGVNVPDFDMASAQSNLQNVLPNTNFIRLNIYSYADPSTYQSFIDWATSLGKVVEIDDHTSFPSNAFSGSQLSAETQWVSSMASAYKNNPYVWFESQNEPQGGDITGEETAFYNAVRGAGNNNPIGMQLWGGGDPNFLSTMNLGAYTSMTNVFIAPHFYDWLAKYSSDLSTISAALNTEISQAQQIQTADGKPPVIIDEFGDSTDGSRIDAGGSQTVAAVGHSGYGYAAWTFENWTGSSGDALTNGGASLTSMGQQVAGFMAATPAAGCAQSAVPTASAATTAPGLAAGGTAVTAPTLASTATDVTAPPLAPASMTVDQVAALASGH